MYGGRRKNYYLFGVGVDGGGHDATGGDGEGDIPASLYTYYRLSAGCMEEWLWGREHCLPAASFFTACL
jgi:hypothetical protein